MSEAAFVWTETERLGKVGNTVLTPPDIGLGRELRLRWERTAQFAVVPIQIEARTECGNGLIAVRHRLLWHWF
jgi:hypothetical protein